jgi:hypothetical protein
MKQLRVDRIIAVAGLVIAFALIGAAMSSSNSSAHAQAECENPPPVDVSRFQRVWDTNFCEYEEGVFEEILSGGVPRDGIPPIDDPTFEPVSEATEWLADQSPVVALEYEGVARAYPLAIMTRHEIVNDVLAGDPLAVTYCPLCNSAIVFDRVVDGETLRLGVSGLLRNSDLIMWDDETESWWQQFTGTGIVGDFTGTQLEIIPSTIVGFGQFEAQYPEGEVLSRNGRSYGSNPYVGYDSSESPFLFRGELDERLPATSRVLAGVIDDVPMAYPFEALAEEQVVNDTLGEREVVAFWQPGATSALDQSDIDESRDVGMATLYRRTVDDETLDFYVDDQGVIRDEQTESAWNVFGIATEGELEGTQLRQELAGAHFWFAWAAFQPETEIYEE